MGFLAFMVLAFGAWLVDSAVQNRHPLQTLTELVKDPASAQATLAKSKDTAYKVPTYTAPVSTGSGTSGISPPAVGTAAGPAAKAVAWAQTQEGKPYKWGATGPNSYDCSGLCQAAYKTVGVNLPRTSYQMLTVGVKVPKDKLLVGDLVWPDLGHVQLYAGNGMVTEAPHTGAFVRTVKMYGYFTARRVVGGSSTPEVK